MSMQFSRRSFNFGLGSLAFAGLAQRSLAADAAYGTQRSVRRLWRLIARSDNLIDLPKGFSYQVISRFGNLMDDGFVVPNAGDGMGAFAAGKNKVALVRNHELSPRDLRFGPIHG
jgi:secreted PhoX family phosphatase